MSDLANTARRAAEENLPPLEGTLAVSGLERPVEVRRDSWGVPHIYAEGRKDLFFAQGFVQAQERGFQLDLFGRYATGRLSELFSELTIPLDRLIRTLGWHRAARRHLADTWDERSREISEIFSRGVIAALEQQESPPVEYRILDIEPEIPTVEQAVEAGAAFGLLLAWSLSRNWLNDLLRAEIAERVGYDTMALLFPDVPTDPVLLQAGRHVDVGRLALLRNAGLIPRNEGSNNWVVAGSRSETGMPLLANDPHLAIQSPSIWYEVHLHAPGYHAAGVALPNAPGVVLGHNERIAWGFTNSEADVQDLYLERLSEDGTQVEWNGIWEPVATHREEIAVRGRAEPEILEVKETRHGPIVDSYSIGIAEPQVVEGGIRKTYAVRWAGYDRGTEPLAIVKLSSARTFEEFREACRLWVCPGNNVVYADVDGNIGYQLTGHCPIRRKGDGTVPLPGWTDEYEWDGYVPFEELPWSFNPESGFLATANAKPYDDSYPHDLGHEFFPPYRARRIVEMITEREKHSIESFARMQVDTVSIPAKQTTPLLLRLEPSDDRQKQALALLGEWNGDLGRDSAAAAIFEVWLLKISERILRPLLGEELLVPYYLRREATTEFHHQVLPTILSNPTGAFFGGEGNEARDRILSEALDAALDDLTARMGEEMTGWRWGAIHAATFAGRLALIPELADLFTAGTVEMGGDDQTVQQALWEPGLPFGVAVIPSWRGIYDTSNWDASVGTHAAGQSGNPASPHFGDMLKLWENGEHHPMPFTREAVEKATEHLLVLQPRS
ncbi:MAG: penicillin acylase family protein [Actinomycetota bacterium]